MYRSLTTSILAAAAIIPLAAMLLPASAAGPNLLTNGSFNANINSWTASAFPQATLAYAAENALVVRNVEDLNASTQASATQCVAAIVAGAEYDFSVKTTIPVGQKRKGAATARAFFFSSNNCSGPALTAPQTPQITQLGVWKTISDTFTAPAGAHSVRIQLMSQKDKAQGPELPTDAFTVVFDDAVLTHQLVIVIPTSTPTKTPTPPILVNPTVAPTKTPTPPILVNPTVAPTNTPTPPILVNPTVAPTSTPTPPVLVNPSSTPTPTSTPPVVPTPAGTAAPGGGNAETPTGPQNQEKGDGSDTNPGDGEGDTPTTNVPGKPGSGTGADQPGTPGAPEAGNGSENAVALKPIDYALPAGLAALGITLAMVAVARRRAGHTD